MTADRPGDTQPDYGTNSSVVVEALTIATCTTFEELCQTSVVLGEPYLSQSGAIGDRVIAEITLRRTVPGRLIVAFPRSVLETLTGRYLPNEVALTPDIVEDAAGEFANVIAGQTKTMLQGTPYHFNLSTPHVGTVVALPSDGSDFLVLPFASDAGGFAVYVYLSPDVPHPGSDSV